MKTESTGLQLCIFVHEGLRHGPQPLYEALVRLARQQGLAGATVYRGIEGFGPHRHVHTARLLDVSDDLPMIVEIVDQAEAVQAFLLLLEGMVPHGATTLEPVEILKVSSGAPR